MKKTVLAKLLMLCSGRAIASTVFLGAARTPLPLPNFEFHCCTKLEGGKSSKGTALDHAKARTQYSKISICIRILMFPR